MEEVQESRLMILEEVEKRDGRRYVLCRCSCGVEKVLRRSQVLALRVRSCGCLHIDVATARVKAMQVHGHAKGNAPTPTYISWRRMRRVCLCPSVKGFEHYGGRGIRICERWDSFQNFLDDMGERPKGLTLDRIDVNGNYEPSNCRWATPSQQSENRRMTVFIEYNGKRQSAAAWAREYGLSANCLRDRLSKQKLPIELALTATPCKGRKIQNGIV